MVTVWSLGFVFEYITISHVPLFILVSLVVVWCMSLYIPEQHLTITDSGQNDLKRAFSSPAAWALLIVCFLVLASHAPYYTFYSIFLEDHDYSRSFIGLMWAIGVIAEVLVFMSMTRLQKISGLRNLFLVSLAITALRWLLIGFFVKSAVILVIAQIFHAASFGIYHAVAIQYVHRFFPGRMRSRGQALYNISSYGVGMALGNLVAGYAWEGAGPLICFTGASVTALLAVLIAWVWIRD
jgi:PPP family 3-phenylpropionic acid transporter